MKEIRNKDRVKNIFQNNGGYIGRNDTDAENIPSWFLYDFVKKNGLKKIAPGLYAASSYPIDEYMILQKRYPKFIFSGLSALYLYGLTDKIPEDIEVCSPYGYNPSRNRDDRILTRRISNQEIYEYGISDVDTMYGNNVKAYDAERTVCDLIKHRYDYDVETFIKAIKLYVKKYNDQRKLFECAKILGVEKKVFEVMEVFANEN